MIETGRRLVLTAVLSIIATGTTSQSVFSVVLAIGFVKLYGFYAPYVEDDDDIMAETGQYQILFTYFGALIMAGELLPHDLNPLVGYLLCMVNVGVPAITFYLIISSALVEYQDALAQSQAEDKEKGLEGDEPQKPFWRLLLPGSQQGMGKGPNDKGGDVELPQLRTAQPCTKLSSFVLFPSHFSSLNL